MGQLFADLDLVCSTGNIQCLLICIHGHELHTLGAGADHAVDHVVAAAANADDLDVDHGLGAGFQSKCHSGASCCLLYERAASRPVNHKL